jgi:hypothetical protein
MLFRPLSFYGVIEFRAGKDPVKEKLFLRSLPHPRDGYYVYAY